MKFKNFLLVTMTACVLSHANAARAQTPFFNPTDLWSVGATEFANVRGLKGTKIPCVLSNEFDNGFIVRFSGGGEKILAMAIDFRQDAFVKGRKYPAVITLGDNYIKQAEASAFTTGTLIFNLRNIDDFYSNLMQQKTMEVSIGNNDFKFSLSDLSLGFPKLEECYAGKKTPVIEPLVAANSAPLKPDAIVVQKLPQSYDEIVSEPRTAVIPNQVVSRKISENVAQEPMPVQMPKNINVAMWTALEGENVKDVLARWSEKAGYDFEWQAQVDNPKIIQDVNLNGSFEDAVSQLMDENSLGSKVRANVNHLGAQGWSAQKGEDLRSVIARWAGQENVEIRWKSFLSLPVKNNVNADGSFEEAVQILLDQYADESVRPLAQLNISPDSGQKTLIMLSGN